MKKPGQVASGKGGRRDLLPRLEPRERRLVVLDLPHEPVPTVGHHAPIFDVVRDLLDTVCTKRKY